LEINGEDCKIDWMTWTAWGSISLRLPAREPRSPAVRSIQQSPALRMGLDGCGIPIYRLAVLGAVLYM